MNFDQSFSEWAHISGKWCLHWSWAWGIHTILWPHWPVGERRNMSDMHWLLRGNNFLVPVLLPWSSRSPISSTSLQFSVLLFTYELPFWISKCPPLTVSYHMTHTLKCCYDNTQHCDSYEYHTTESLLSGAYWYPKSHFSLEPTDTQRVTSLWSLLILKESLLSGAYWYPNAHLKQVPLYQLR